MILDSSVLVAYFNHADASYQEACEVMNGLSEWIILEPIVFEAITALQMRADKKIAQQALRYLQQDLRTNFFSIDQSDFRQALELYGGQKGSLTLYDWMLFAASKRTRIPVKSFDRKLNRILAVL